MLLRCNVLPYSHCWSGLNIFSLRDNDGNFLWSNSWYHNQLWSVWITYEINSLNWLEDRETSFV